MQWYKRDSRKRGDGTPTAAQMDKIDRDKQTRDAGKNDRYTKMQSVEKMDIEANSQKGKSGNLEEVELCGVMEFNGLEIRFWMGDDGVKQPS